MFPSASAPTPLARSRANRTGAPWAAHLPGQVHDRLAVERHQVVRQEPSGLLVGRQIIVHDHLAVQNSLQGGVGEAGAVGRQRTHAPGPRPASRRSARCAHARVWTRRAKGGVRRVPCPASPRHQTAGTHQGVRRADGRFLWPAGHGVHRGRPPHLTPSGCQLAVNEVGARGQDDQHVPRAIRLPGDPIPASRVWANGRGRWGCMRGRRQGRWLGRCEGAPTRPLGRCSRATVTRPLAKSARPAGLLARHAQPHDRNGLDALESAGRRAGAARDQGLTLLPLNPTPQPALAEELQVGPVQADRLGAGEPALLTLGRHARDHLGDVRTHRLRL